MALLKLAKTYKDNMNLKDQMEKSEAMTHTWGILAMLYCKSSRLL